MNNKGTNIRSYVILAVILISALVFVFYLFNSEKEARKAKPIADEVETTEVVENEEKEVEEEEEETTTTTTTVAVDNNESNVTPVNTEPVSNFSAPLTDVIDGLEFIRDYSVTTFFHGVEFDFNCTNFDENQNSCLEGSALMKVDNALYPLYTYSNQTDNYLLRGNDYYIILRDDIVVLYTANSGVSAGSARIFDRNGTSLGALPDTLTSYVYQGKLYSKIYPSIEENTMYYYTCTDNQVVIKSVVIGNFGDIQILEPVEGSCYK